MSRKAALGAIGIVVAANLGMLALAWWNVSGEPEASMVLTERELRLPQRGMEETGISLTLAWNRPYDVAEEDLPLLSWFDRPKLESIGFDCRVAPDNPAARTFYAESSHPPRHVYAVLEYRPNEPTAIGDERATAGATGPEQPSSPAPGEPGTTRLRRAPLTEADRSRLSRLIPVDVGLDRAALRARYPDRQRFVIIEGAARLIFETAEAGRRARLRGSLNFVTPNQVFVPRERRAMLDALLAAQLPNATPFARLDHDPRYRVTVRFGRNLQPWVERVEAIR